MKFQVRLLAKAEQDVEIILQWFCEQSATAAPNRWFDQLMARIDTLERSPDRCRFAAEAEELGIELQELLFGKRRGVYRILFVISGQTVNVLHIRHSVRDTVRRDEIQ